MLHEGLLANMKRTEPKLGRLSRLIPLAHSSGYKAESLARICCVSDRQLRRHFHERFGRSTQDWLDEQRMVAATYLLRQTPRVKYVAYELGFRRVGHFSRHFKQYHGVTPSEFLRLSQPE